MTTARPLRVLFVEDREKDVELLVLELHRGGYDVVEERVDTPEAFAAALDRQRWDLILCDYRMPRFSAPAALALVEERKVDLPFIVVSGTVGEETAVAALHAGAHDFLAKDKLSRLLPAIDRELREAASRAERRKTQQALRLSERRYRTVVENAHDAILVATEGTVIVEANRQAGGLWGVAASDLVGMSAADLVAHEHRPRVRASFAGLGSRGSVRIPDLLMRRKDGSTFVADASVTMLSLDDQPMHVVIVRDVTEQKKMQEQLLISERMASVGTLAAGVAHEINNPLAALLANLNFAAKELTSALEPGRANDGAEAASAEWLRARVVEAKEPLEDAREAANRVREIVRDIKIFSRSGDEERRGPVDVRRVMESSLRMVSNEIRHRARLVKSYEEVPAVEGNESRLAQVFLNLVVNAAQAIPEGRLDANEIRVLVRPLDGDRVLVAVSDTGSGIPAENLPRLFEPFFTTKPVGIGTGLGLAICHRIVTSLGGEIRVESELGKGTTFQLLLPVAREEAALPDEPAVPQLLASRRGRVLVIDDEPMLCAAVRRMLAPEHEVYAVTTASEALARIALGDRFDVILCDVMMPQMTGMDFYERLTRAAPEQLASLVFMTGGAFTSAARAFLDHVPNARLEKPFDAQNLRVMVHSVLAR